MPRQEILRINRTKEQAEKAYDKLSGVYDVLAGPFEKKFRDHALKLLRYRRGRRGLRGRLWHRRFSETDRRIGGPCRQSLRNRHLAWNDESGRETTGKGRPLGQSRA